MTEPPSAPQVSALLTDELRDRNTSVSRPVVVTLETPDHRLSLVPPGSVGLIMGWPGSKLFSELTEAAMESEPSLPDLLEEAIDSTEAALDSDLPVASSFSEIPLFGEFRYGTTTLVKGIFVTSTVEVELAAVLYNGGRLEGDEFQFISYSLQAGLAGDALVIVNPPQLTDLETRLLESLPPSQLHVNLTSVPQAVPAVVATIVAREGIRRGTMWTAETFAAAGVGWGVGKGLDAAWNRIRGGVSAFQVETMAAQEELDPTASARQLLELRIRALQATRPKVPYSQ